MTRVKFPHASLSCRQMRQNIVGSSTEKSHYSAQFRVARLLHDTGRLAQQEEIRREKRQKEGGREKGTNLSSGTSAAVASRVTVFTLYPCIPKSLLLESLHFLHARLTRTLLDAHDYLLIRYDVNMLEYKRRLHVSRVVLLRFIHVTFVWHVAFCRRHHRRTSFVKSPANMRELIVSFIILLLAAEPSLSKPKPKPEMMVMMMPGGGGCCPPPKPCCPPPKPCCPPPPCDEGCGGGGGKGGGKMMMMPMPMMHMPMMMGGGGGGGYPMMSDSMSYPSMMMYPDMMDGYDRRRRRRKRSLVSMILTGLPPNK